MNRRSVLQFLSAVPVMGRGLESKLKHELMSGRLSSIQGVSSSVLSRSDLPPSPIKTIDVSNKIAMQIPWFRDELRALLVEEQKRVHSIDPDLAVLKSVSLSAKIYYQRQRNVDTAMSSYALEPPWMRINALWSKVRSLIGGKTYD